MYQALNSFRKHSYQKRYDFPDLGQAANKRQQNWWGRFLVLRAAVPLLGWDTGHSSRHFAHSHILVAEAATNFPWRKGHALPGEEQGATRLHDGQDWQKPWVSPEIFYSPSTAFPPPLPANSYHPDRETPALLQLKLVCSPLSHTNPTT